MRALTGVKVRRGKAKQNLSKELADCLILIADIANNANIDLTAATASKLNINLKRGYTAGKKPR